MQSAQIRDVNIEYEVTGSGEPVLFISPVLADGFRPLLRHEELVDHYRLIHYHRRGWAGSTRTPGPVDIGVHAADALALLDHLRVSRAHVVGHSSGAAVAAQLALDAPGRVHTLTLLELSLLSLRCGQEFLQQAGPVFQLYRSGDHEGAFAAFMSAVSGLDWATCQALLEEQAPGTVEQSVTDADTFFGVELPSLVEWSLTADRAKEIRQPVLSILGSETQPLWVEVAAFLQSHAARLEEDRIDGVGHLLHIQKPDPVARTLASFLDRNPISAGRGITASRAY